MIKKIITTLSTFAFIFFAGVQITSAAATTVNLSQNTVTENNQSGIHIGFLSYETNDGPLLFSAGTLDAGLLGTRELVSADFNADGFDDIYKYVYGGGNEIWLNDGSGNYTLTFTNTQNLRTRGVVFADFNEDGHMDIYDANYSYQQNNIWLSDGAGSYTLLNIVGDASASVNAIAEDFNGDGHIDIYTLNSGGNFANRLWLNDGAANFTPHHITGDTGWTYGGDAADIDADGDIDIVTGGYYGGVGKVWVNDGSANFTQSFTIPSGKVTTDLKLRDIDGDNDPDMYIFNDDNQQNEIWVNDGLGNFTQSTGILNDLGWSFRGDIGDVDGDGDFDIYVSNGVNSTMQNKLWLNDGAAGFINNDITGDTNDSRIGVFFDHDNDGDKDILTSGRVASGDPLLWINDSPLYTVSISCAVSGADDALFSINTNDRYSLRLNESSDFETKQQYTVCVRVTDGTNHYDQNVVVNVTDIFDANPTVVIQDTTTPVSAVIGSVDALTTDLEITLDGVTYVLGVDVELILNNGIWELNLADPLKIGQYDIIVSSSDGTTTLLDTTTSEIIVREERKKSSQKTYACNDKKATNYSKFGVHKQSLCEYAENIDAPDLEDIETGATELNPFNGEMCPVNLLIHNNMKNGDTDGRYGAYEKGIVTEIKLLQGHMNRLLVDDYGQQASGPVDGYFRSLTERGVERLQKKLNQLLPDRTPLVLDGIVGPFTRAAINHSC